MAKKRIALTCFLDNHFFPSELSRTIPKELLGFFWDIKGHPLFDPTILYYLLFNIKDVALHAKKL